MKTAPSVQIGIRVLIFLNMMMAFASIWVFMRMAPAIEEINLRNERSLESCEKMLMILAILPFRQVPALELDFDKAYRDACNNITEKGETEELRKIGRVYKDALAGNVAAREQTISSIYGLARINRNAMLSAAEQAKKLGYSGAWGVVFMAVMIFSAGILFIRRLKTRLLDPLTEIREVLSARKAGDVFRRCPSSCGAADIRCIYEGVNALLDGSESRKE